MMMPMLMMLVLTLLNLPDAFNVDAYAAANDANVETKMPNATRHLVGANVVLLFLLMMPLFLMLMMMPMLMMLVLTLMNLPDAFDVAAYATANDANVETKMPNATRHLAGANVVLLMLMLLVVMRVMLVMILFRL